MKLLGPALLCLAASPALLALGCESVKDLDLNSVTVTMAETVPAGGFQPVGGRGGRGGRGAAAFAQLPAFCRVAATLRPTSDSEIKIEVWMPVGRRWNGDLESVGNGAWAGSISYPAMATALAGGYATASTDTGHTGNTPTFIPGHPEKVTDFAYRAVHEMTVAAKAILAKNYGREPRYSYFNGCSTGGRQALTEAQRYPEDYNGIIAGAPANWTTRLQGAQVWTAEVVNRDPDSMIPPEKYALIHSAALVVCDAADGVRDGVIESPLTCHFDPAAIQCPEDDEDEDADKGDEAEEMASCLTAAQADSARKIYKGPTDAQGNVLFPGLEPGSELGWRTLSGGDRPMSLAEEVYSYLVFDNPDWDYKTFEPARDMAIASARIGEEMDSIDADLSPFFDRGGKLVMYHGWADPGIAPRNSVNYYQDVVAELGENETAKSMKLFMVPGMGHCAGGDGTSTFDLMSVARKWTEGDIVPLMVPAERVRNGQTDRTRPLCPFPQVATYKGTGSTDDIANFSCAAP